MPAEPSAGLGAALAEGRPWINLQLSSFRTFCCSPAYSIWQISNLPLLLLLLTEQLQEDIKPQGEGCWMLDAGQGWPVGCGLWWTVWARGFCHLPVQGCPHLGKGADISHGIIGWFLLCQYVIMRGKLLFWVIFCSGKQVKDCFCSLSLWMSSVAHKSVFDFQERSIWGCRDRNSELDLFNPFIIEIHFFF